MQFNSKRVVISSLCLSVLSGATSLAQGVPGVVCKPLSQRTQEIGCWIMAGDPIGQLKQSPVFWHLDGYPARAAAEADRGPTGTVVQSFGLADDDR